MGKLSNVVDTCMLTIGSVYSLANLEQMLGIIILVVQLAWILTKLVVKIVNTVKHKESLDTIEDDVGSALDSLNGIMASLKEGRSEDNDGDS